MHLQKTDTIPAITSVRFFILIVLVLHFAGSIFLPETALRFQNAFNFFPVAISFYFTISGFLLSYEYKTTGTGFKNSFLIIFKKVLRFYPIYLFGLFAMVLFALINTQTLHFSPLIHQVLIVQSLITSSIKYYNIPGWIISCEALYYLVYPILIIFYKRIGLLNSWGFATILWCGTQIYSEHRFETDEYFIYHSALIHFNQFVIGNLAGLVLPFLISFKKNYIMEMLMVIVSVLFITGIDMNADFRTGFLCVIFLPIIWLLALDTGPISKLLSNRFLVFLGKSSTTALILHLPFFTALYNFFPLNNPFVFGVGLFILILISAGIHYTLESFFLKIKTDS